MKKTVFTFVLVCISFFIYSQELHNNHFTPNAEGWLLDSIYHTSKEDGDQRIFRIVERNDFGFPLKEESLNYNFTTNEYEIIYSAYFSYPIENDSNEFYKTIVYDVSTGDSASIYTNYNDTGYYVESYERWQNGSLLYGRLEKRNIILLAPCYHNLEYKKQHATDDWTLMQENKSDFNSDSTIRFDFSYNGQDTIMDTTSKSFTYYNEYKLPYAFAGYFKVDGEWEQLQASETAYNDNNDVMVIQRYKFYTNELVYDYKIIFEYDDNGSLSSYQTFVWDLEFSLWKYDFRNDYVIDSNGNLLTEIAYGNISDTLWNAQRKIEYQYNEDNKVTRIETAFPKSDGLWRNQFLSLYFHHSDQHYSNEQYLWDTTSSTYINSIKIEKSLDEYNRLIQTQYYEAEEPNFTWQLKSTSSYLFQESENQQIKKEINYNNITEDTTLIIIKYYNILNTGMAEVFTNHYSIFPNPSSSLIFIQSEIFNSQSINYEIYNLKGQLMKTGNLNSRGILNIEQLNDGIYLLKIYKPNKAVEVLKFQKL